MTHHIRESRWIPICCLLFMAALLTGCDDNGPLGHKEYRFAVNFEPDYTGVEPCWVILHDGADNQAIAAYRLDSEYLDSVIVEDSPISFTAIWARPPANENDLEEVWLQSYLGVPAGEFFINTGLASRPLGSIDVTFIFPSGDYDKGVISVAGESHIFHPEPGDTVETVRLALYESDDNDKISIYGMVQGNGTGYCGWTVSEIYLPYGNIACTIRANHPLVQREFHASEPLAAAGLFGYREPFRSPIDVDYSEWNGAQTDFSFLSGDFPAQKWNLWGIGTAVSNTFRSAQKFSSQIPTRLDMSDMFVAAIPDSHGGVSVQVSGTPDILMCAWDGYFSVPPMGLRVYWEVWANPQVTSLRPPQIPDSVLAELGFTPNGLEPDYQLLWDFEPAGGYRDIVRKLYMSIEPRAAQFTDMHAFSNAFSLSSETNSAAGEQNTSSRMRQRHHQFLR